MFIFFTILFGIIIFIVGAGATHGYAQHRWPTYDSHYDSIDDPEKRALATIFWPFYWIFIWPFTKVNEVILSNIEKSAAQQIVRNKARVSDLHATRAQVEASNP